MPEIPELELIDIPSAAAMTGNALGKQRLWRLIREGELPGVVRVGRRILIRKREFVGFLLAGGTSPTPGR